MFHNKKNSKKLVLNLSSKKPLQPSLQQQQVTENDHNKKEEHFKLYYQEGPARILPNLYLGSSYNAQCIQQLAKIEVNLIINVASEVNHSTAFHHLFEYHHIRWTHNQENFDFDRVIKIIQQAHSQNKVVLIHCQQGIERSATLVLAYLIFLSRCSPTRRERPSCTHGDGSGDELVTTHSLAGQNWSLDQALTYVKKLAPNIRPNMNQIYQLREYEKSIPIMKEIRRSGSVTLRNSNKLPQVRRQRAVSVRELPSTKPLWDYYQQQPEYVTSPSPSPSPSSSSSSLSLSPSSSSSLIALEKDKKEKVTVATVLLVACMAVYHKNHHNNM